MNERHDLRDFDGGPVDHQLLIRLMGDFQVVIGGRAIGDDDWRLANARTLIKLLALAPKQRLHREQVIEMFWPDLDPDAAANNLRYTLHVARRTLDPDRRADDHVIQYRRGWISLKARAGIWIDAVAFEEAAAVAEAEADLRAHYRALDLYAGELLPGDRYAD